MTANFDSLVEFISQNSGISNEEILKKIELKQAKLAGLISKEGAAQVVAAELNISFDKQFVKIFQITPGLRKINLVGKIITLFPIREYNKNGRSGRIGSFILADETSNIRTVLWDENHIELIATGKITQDSVVEISNASLRNGELHLSSFSEIKLSNKLFPDIVKNKPVVKKNINLFVPGETVSTRAFIVQMFEPKFFNICPECKKKVNELSECIAHGKVLPQRRALLSFVIDDGTSSIRAVAFSEQLEKIMPLSEFENFEVFSVKKKDFLGKEMIFSGQVRNNQMFNTNEFIVTGFEEIELNNLIQELEN